MNQNYVPILRWKTGEQNCLATLTPEVCDNILPFIELPTPTVSKTPEAAEKKYVKLINSFNKSWPDRPFFLYLLQEWYSDTNASISRFERYLKIYNEIKHPYAIPAFDISDKDSIIKAADICKKSGLCLRIRISDFEHLDTTLSLYIKQNQIIPELTYLLFDLECIPTENYPQREALNTALSKVANISAFKAVIISSCSFPKDISNAKTNAVTAYPRCEIQIHEKAHALQQQYSFRYLYSDYGPHNIFDTEYIPGMIPNFKIKYTTAKEYLVVKGFSTKKGGLDLSNVALACKALVNHSDFSGAVFSFGDKCIYDIASHILAKSGNLTTWVAYCFSHHITLINSIL